MRYAVMLHDLRNELLCQQLFQDGTRAYQAGSMPNSHCGEYANAGELVDDIRTQRQRGIGFLHYLLHPASTGGAIERKRIELDSMWREEVQGDGLIHLYLQAQGPTAWLLRLEAPAPSAQLSLAGWKTTAIELEARRMIGLMRRYGQVGSTPNTRYWRKPAG